MRGTGVSARAWQARVINTLKYPMLQRIVGLLRIDLLRNITPFDARCMVTLIVVPAVWKLLSDDFGSLPGLCDRAPLFSFRPAWVYRWFVDERCTIFAMASPQTLQVITSVCLLAFVVRPYRLLLIPGLFSFWLLDTTAYLYRANTYSLDTPIALLLLICLVPVPLRQAISSSMKPNGAARLVVVAALIYV